jgi:hypothetical protein
MRVSEPGMREQPLNSTFERLPRTEAEPFNAQEISQLGF